MTKHRPIDRVKAQKLILSNFQSPGDVVMLTAAVRDLHARYPGRFITDVRTLWPDLWRNNPYLTALNDADPDARHLECQYPLIQVSNHRPVHFLYGFIENLNDQLGLCVQPTRCHGDIHLSDLEKVQSSLVSRMTGRAVRYWIIVAGGKYDYTIKWWHFRRWQAVVDHFRDQILFVHVGDQSHYHPRLDGVLDLRGQTSLRDLIHLVYHADGVLCPVTLLMHLAAAVEPRPGVKTARACVVVAGGREPPHWEAYPTHQFLHTVGLLPCCAQGGCWRSRAVPLGDGGDKDDPKHLCVDLVDNLPHCMHLITPEMVAERIELCLALAPASKLTGADVDHLAPYLSRNLSWPPLGKKAPTTCTLPFLAQTNNQQPKLTWPA